MYNPDNVFAKIIKGELSADKIYENEYVLSFYSKFPVVKIHALVIPKVKCVSFSDFVEKTSPEEVGNFFQKVKFVAEDILKLKDSGYRLVMNHGKDAEQSVFHFHVHILGGELMQSGL